MSKNYAAGKFWKALARAYENAQKAHPDISMKFNSNKQDKFEQIFTDYYENIRTNFMTEETEALDRHKQAAIFVVSAIEAGVVSQQCDEHEMALAQYVIVLDVSLSYLVGCINRRLNKIGKSIPRIQLPSAWACDTKYFTILSRILYYENEDTKMAGTEKMSYNVIEWSDRFFLLEYITLIQNQIDPNFMKDKYWDFERGDDDEFVEES